jgi:Astacin (Peptidase family M12A)
MHYPRDAFSSTGEDTIIPKQPDVEIGQRKKLSDGDIKSVEKLITI